MNVSFLETTCETCLINNRAQFHVKNKREFDKLKYFLVNEIRDNLKELYNNDIYTYHIYSDRSNYSQYKIIENYINMCYPDDEVITEGVYMLIGFLTALFAFSSNKTSKFVATLAKGIASITDKVGTFLSSQGKQEKLRYAIIYQNLEDCYKKAGVKPEQLSALHYVGVSDDPYIPKFSVTSAKEVDDLKECYVKYQILTIGQLLKAYFMCIQKTGDPSVISRLKDDDLMKIIAGLQLSTVCKEYFDIIKEAFDKFYALLDLIYEKESKKSEKLKELKDELIKAKSITYKPQQEKTDQKQGQQYIQQKSNYIKR